MSLGNGSFTRTYGAQSTQNVIRFFLSEQQDDLATAREGRPIFKSEERLEIIMPGNPYTRPVRRVTNADRQEYAQQYEAFKRGQDVAVSGTPLEQWSMLKPAQVRELKALEIHTMEQLANLSDLVIQRIGMGGRRLRDHAQAYLDDAQSNALASRLEHENDELRSKIAAQDLQLQQLQEMMQQMHQSLLTLQNAPNPIQGAIPGATDPMEALRQGFGTQGAQQAAASSLEAFDAAPRRRGRPPKEQTAA